MTAQSQKSQPERFPAGFFSFSADDRLRAQPVAPVQIVLCVDMGAVAAGIGAQVAVFVVEHLVDVDVEDVLPVGQRGKLLIEAVDAGVIERRVRARARGLQCLA